MVWLAGLVGPVGVVPLRLLGAVVTGADANQVKVRWCRGFALLDVTTGDVPHSVWDSPSVEASLAASCILRGLFQGL
ncbi:hypothetical protein PBS_04820 [Paraburkholderia sp. 2C]